MNAQSWRVGVATLGLIVATACSHNNGQTEEELSPRPDPVPVHVKNENFLDMNVYYVAGSFSRRLGTVTGNSAADFTVDWAYAGYQGISLVAFPIGGSGRAAVGPVNVGVGQMIEFRIGSVLRQSTIVVQEP
jgi:hypothetical protein